MFFTFIIIYRYFTWFLFISYAWHYDIPSYFIFNILLYFKIWQLIVKNLRFILFVKNTLVVWDSIHWDHFSWNGSFLIKLSFLTVIRENIFIAFKLSSVLVTKFFLRRQKKIVLKISCFLELLHIFWLHESSSKWVFYFYLLTFIMFSKSKKLRNSLLLTLKLDWWYFMKRY